MSPEPATTSVPVKESVIAAESRLTQAEREGDRRALSTLLSDAFTGIEAHGRRVGKREFIALFCDSRMKFSRMDIEDLAVVNPTDSMAIVIGRSVYSVTVAGRVVHGSSQFLDCWQRTEGDWSLISSSVTPEEKSPLPALLVE